MKNGVRIKPSTILLSVSIVTALTLALATVLWPYLPQAVKNTLPEQPANSVTQQNETKTTRAIIGDGYLDTDPAEWFGVGEDVNWNDIVTVCVESVHVSKTLPTDINDMTETYVYGFAHYQDLVNADADRLFMDITVSVTCTALPSGSLYGVSFADSQFTVTTGGMWITYFDRENGTITENESEGGRCVAVQDLSGNVTGTPSLMDMYELKVGETARFRVLHIISNTMWLENDVLLTPQFGFGAWQLNLLYYSQPHIRLNERSIP